MNKELENAGFRVTFNPDDDGDFFLEGSFPAGCSKRGSVSGIKRETSKYLYAK